MINSTTDSEIMVVDDNPANLGLLQDLLKSEGYRVRLFPSGDLALRSTQYSLPDLILLDIRMPGMSGYEVCRRLKSRPESRQTPIIFLSALRESPDKVKAFQVGGVDYVTKPFENAEVLARVRTHLELRHMQTRLTQMVADRTDELEVANRALSLNESRLREQKTKAEAASEAKSAFLAMMSHEIRTPMNAIVGMSDLLEETEPTPEQHRLLEVIQRAARTLLELIEDVLDLSQIEADAFNLENLSFDLSELIEEILDVMFQEHHKKGLWLTLQMPPDLPLQRIGDPRRLRQVLTNLIGNAIKFSHQGEIQLRIAQKELVGSGNILSFSVADQGIGISSDQLEEIFHPFTQADSSYTRRYGGKGLGLSIAKRLVERMGGEIGVASQPGVGSEFHFTLPLDLDSNQAPLPWRPGALSGRKVLFIAEPKNIGQALIDRIVHAGAEVRIQDSGNLKQDFIRTHEDELIVVDCLDEMEQRLSWAQEACGANPGLRLVLVMGPEEIGAIRKIRPLRIPVLLSPIKSREIQQALESMLSAPKAVQASASEGAMTTPMRILLAEDCEDNAVLMRAMLKKTPHHLDVAENGAQALRMVQDGRYDLVLMDMQMPVMDGYQTTRAIRAWECDSARAHPLPIVALTAHAMAGDAARSLAAGCDLHLTKPIRKTKLMETLARFQVMEGG